MSAETVGRGTPGSPRTPGLFNLAVVGLVVGLVATVALTSRQTPPPTVAEFAPQAVEQIEETLPEQDEPAPGAEGEPGDAPSEEPTLDPDDPEATASPEASPSPEETLPDDVRARVRKCAGDPPRQTEDPQSPPCVPFFDGDNGGETWQGVTADEIVIAYPNLEVFGAEPIALIQLMVDHFNRRYEFYGRKMVLAEYTLPGFGAPDPTLMIADAVKVDEELQAFASIGYGARGGAEHHYYDELARREIPSVNAGIPSRGTEERYAQLDPYEWSWNATVTTQLQLAGDFVCTTLAPNPPIATGTGINDPLGGAPDERVFGVVTLRAQDGTEPPSQLLLNSLSNCGANVAVTVSDDAGQPQSDNVILQMSNAGVTSILCVCAELSVLRAQYMQSASNQGYFPEWVMTGIESGDLDNSFVAGQAPQEQARNVFGISSHDRYFQRQQMPFYRAIREGDPTQDPAGGVYYTLNGRYQQLLHMASAIQLAGPDLNPTTFAAGLKAARWPNPGAGAAPQYQAAIDFSVSHGARNSVTFIWNSTTDGGVVDPAVPGATCYVDAGKRYTFGTFPATPPGFLQPPCIR